MMIQGAPAVGALVSSIPYMLTFNVSWFSLKAKAYETQYLLTFSL